MPLSCTLGMYSSIARLHGAGHVRWRVASTCRLPRCHSGSFKAANNLLDLLPSGVKGHMSPVQARAMLNAGARMIELARKGVRDGRGRLPGQLTGRPPKAAPSAQQAAQDKQSAERRKLGARCGASAMYLPCKHNLSYGWSLVFSLAHMLTVPDGAYLVTVLGLCAGPCLGRFEKRLPAARWCKCSPTASCGGCSAGRPRRRRKWPRR